MVRLIHGLLRPHHTGPSKQARVTALAETEAWRWTNACFQTIVTNIEIRSQSHSSSKEAQKSAYGMTCTEGLFRRYLPVKETQSQMEDLAMQTCHSASIRWVLCIGV